jgi:hypothetical protein
MALTLAESACSAWDLVMPLTSTPAMVTPGRMRVALARSYRYPA